MMVFTRMRNLLLHPAREWAVIAAEGWGMRRVFVRFLAPMLCVLTVATVAGTWLDTSRALYSAPFVLCRVLLLWTSVPVGMFVASFLLTEFAAPQTGARDYDRVFALMVYSAGAACLVAVVVALIPFFRVLAVLALYSCYVYWLGLTHFMQLDGQKQRTFAWLSLVVTAPVFSLLFFLFWKIFSSMLL